MGEKIMGVLGTPSRLKAVQQRWLEGLARSGGHTQGRIPQEELAQQAHELLDLLATALRSGTTDVAAPPYAPVRAYLDSISRSRALQNFSSSETATFVLSLKQALFEQLRQDSGTDAEGLATDIWTATTMLDALGLHTVQAFQQTREEVIRRQQEELLELSTPVVKLWDGILALPMIGTLDSARTQVVMESLLNKIVDTGSEVAILDITGVPTVDTLVAQHLIKTVTALRLMGAECIISGVRPQIAQTIVHLGVDLQGITTKATLADALALALKRTGYKITR
jgi:rsbT co-antagonist protein RsbR